MENFIKHKSGIAVQAQKVELTPLAAHLAQSEWTEGQSWSDRPCLRPRAFALAVPPGASLPARRAASPTAQDRAYLHLLRTF